MLIDEQIEQNKQEYIRRLRSINRPGADIESLLYYLENSDFFVAPASSIYHGNYKGGLCEHLLQTDDNAIALAKTYYKDAIPWDEDSIHIAALTHDFAKIYFYEIYSKNVKMYSETGSKHDEGGKFDWRVEKAYKVRDESDRFLYGSHGQNSEYIVGQYIPLTLEESVAIINHMGYQPDCAKDLTPIYNKYSLAVIIHIADLMSSYLDQKSM